MWYIVENRTAEAVYCCSMIDNLQVSFDTTQYNTVITVGDSQTQIGLGDRVTGAMWLQCPQLACLLGTGITLDAHHIWLDDVLVFENTDDQNTTMPGSDIISAKYYTIDHAFWTITQMWGRLNRTFKTLFSLMRAQNPVMGINQPIVEHVQRILSMLEFKEPLPLEARQAVSKSITELAQFYSFQGHKHPMLVELKDLHQMTIEGDVIYYREVEIPKTLFTSMLYANCRDTFMVEEQ